MNPRVILPGKRRGRVTVPSSKSIAHREIIAAALSGVEGPAVRGESRDTLATRACLKAMISGESVWPCGESGSTLRFLTPVAGVMGWKGEFKCEGRLAARPQMPFEKKDRYVVAGDVSSQFISGLLMALPLASWNSEIVVEGNLESSAYVELTEDVLKAAGIVFEKSGLSWKIPGSQRYRIAGGREVEGDWSQAAFFLAMGVRVDGLDNDSKQGDRAVAWLLDEREVDASPVPDLIPALAVHAAAREGETRFFNCARLRIKESDRLESTAALVNGVGGEAKIVDDGLVVSGRRGLTGGEVRTFGDHRIAMAAALAACYSRSPVVIDDESVVAKSYPGFWDDFGSLSLA
jgi:3-phosphoshikimate 1-carboxyvinyltransferase